MKKLFINILCGFIPNRQVRKSIRMELNNPIRKWIKFAKSFSNKRHPSVKCTYGYRCVNFVVNIDDKWVFKFPLKDNGYEIANREKRIVDALRPVSPIKIPKMEIVDFDGLAVRKYECVKGVGFNHLTHDVQDKHIDKIAKQLANFLYVVGKSDPKEIRDLKSNKNDKALMMYGWNQNDLWDNFIMNPKNFDIVAVIDWEGAGFNDFYACFTSGIGNDKMKQALLREYLRIAKFSHK